MTDSHLCIVALPLTPGGAERLVSEEAKYFYRNGYQVSIVTPQYSKGFVEDMGIPDRIELIDYGSTNSEITGAGFFHRTRQIRDKISAIRPDIIFSHYCDQEVYLATKTIRRDIPFVCQINGSPFWSKSDLCLYPHQNSDKYEDLLNSVPGHTMFRNEEQPPLTTRMKAEIIEYLRQSALQESISVFVLSNQVRKEVKGLYGIDPHVIRPGVSQEWISKGEETTCIDLTDKHRAILSVSRLDPRKRIDQLIKAFAGLRQRRSDVGLVIVGTGEQENKLRDLAKELDVADSVKFEGYVPDKELPSYYKSADVFACPGWMSYGLTPLEAYSMGTKVALSSDAFAHEILENQPGVTVVPPKVNDWVGALDELLGAEFDIKRNIVPTWKTYCVEKHRIVSQQGALEDNIV